MSQLDKGSPHPSATGGVYEPAGFFLLRAPVLPVTAYHRLMAPADNLRNAPGEDLDRALREAGERIRELLRAAAARAEIRQALRAASPSLADATDSLDTDGTSARRTERTYRSLLRYLIRMSTRATPFGLFAGVAAGRFGDRTEDGAGTAPMRLGLPVTGTVHTRPDMNWLMGLVERIERDESSPDRLGVVANPTAHVAGDRLVLPVADIYGTRDTRSITLRATGVVLEVLKRAARPVAYATLREGLIRDLPQAGGRHIDTLLRTLWSHGFLMSDLRPALSDPRAAATFAERLPDSPRTAPLRQALATAVDLAERTRAADPAERERLFARLHRHQTGIHDSGAPPFQVDLALSTVGDRLPRAVGDVAADAAETLLRLGLFPSGFRHLRGYHDEFVQRYGEEAEVPLLELLSAEAGLGPPASYTEPVADPPRQAPPAPATPHRDVVLCNLVSEALRSGAREVELTDGLLDALAQWQPEAGQSAPEVLDVYLQLHAESPEALETDDWHAVLCPTPLADGGRTFGRFTDVLPASVTEGLRECARREEAGRPEAVFAELSYLPLVRRAANVVVHPELRDHEIVVNSSASVPEGRTISLSDLVVGVLDGRFYVRSQRLGKEVVVGQSHLLTDLQAPNVCRFLLEIAQDRHPLLAAFHWGPYKSAPFVPRLRRGKVVISPAQWVLQHDTVRPTGPGDDSTRAYRGVQEWRERWRVPRHVYLVEFDNRLLLDLQHPSCVSELLTALAKTKAPGRLAVQEVLPDSDHHWLRDTEGRAYASEVVVPVWRRTRTQAPRRPGADEPLPVRLSRYPARPPAPADLRKLPGEEWVYLKLYTPTRRQDEAVARPLAHLVAELRDQGLLADWFFMRYADPEPHLRIRLLATAGQEADAALLARSAEWAREVVRSGLARRFCFDTYFPEVWRYGGPVAMTAVERAFGADSDVSQAVIAARHAGALRLDPAVTTAFCLDRLLEAWGLTFDERLAFIRARSDKDEFSEAFKPHRTELCELLRPWRRPADGPERQVLLAMTGPYAERLGTTATTLHELHAEGSLWQGTEDILASLVHMHVNRACGIGVNRERKIYAFWRKALDALEQRPDRTEVTSR
ncbi:lantibiotic dehydratase [Streptomyces sp. TRM68416]|uniref:lantibiotic dehydratase n=1 Tax=Streptomyces sp. TRM68416 TaxID=2758412 RepID=UPI00166191C3|nr:lantibiotic dehydratase [Streptomyces sp. TRM68416]MBD0839921.1 lantibiotic dehydratase [Streptomyces sp. TRM68416]